MATRGKSRFNRKSSIIRDKAGNARQTLITRGPGSVRKHRRVVESMSWTKDVAHLTGKGDCVMIDDFTNEGLFLKNLHDRYDVGIIYTYIRGVCISVNPYQDLGIYTGALIDEYYGAQLHELPPHLYAVANQAYYAMKEESTDQCILISGESGAGKTEAAKQILQFLASTATNTGRSSNIRDRLLQSNPILEAFGNAKTLRNDNSSRFGKYMQVEFDFKGEPLGGKIINYLLEKSRVVNQMEGERNFHVFYMLLDTAEKEARALANSADEYHYTRQGKISKVETLNDVEEMDNMIGAAEGLGFAEDETKSMLDLVGFVIHLGQVEFTTGDAASVANPDAVKAMASLIGTPSEVLMDALTHKTVVARGETVVSPLNQEQASYARDALGKAAYYRAFDWVVHRLNTALGMPAEGAAGRTTVMGLLDIYGFEILAKNGFEQICINYCNEKLQQLFIELTLKSEQEEYRKEGIEWVPIDYFNNEVLCQLIESSKKPIGLLTVLDDCCTAPGNQQDSDFLAAMDVNFSKNERYESFAGNKKLQRDQFVVKHYAGDVIYTIDGFMDTNNDMLFRDLKVAMTKSTNPVVKSQFPLEELELKKRPPTAGHQFRTNMNDLMGVLMAKSPSYIRCIKPNHEKKANSWDEDAVQHQVKYLGLMENLRVARAGYCYRRTFTDFLDRYKSLCPGTWPNFAGNPKDGVKLLTDSLAAPKVPKDPSPWVRPVFHLGLEPGEIAIGNTKIFIKNPKSVTAIEKAFQENKNNVVTRIAAAWRGHAQRQRFLKLKAAAIAAQKFARVVIARKNAEARRAAVDKLRFFIKGFITRRDPPNECNKAFIELSKKLWLLKLARHSPTGVLDSSWTSPAMTPASCTEASAMLRSLVHTNNCRKFRLGLTVEQKRQFTLKLAAEVMFKGKKASYPASVGMPFVTNRIEDEAHFAGAKEAFAKVKSPGENIRYSTLLHKFDRSSLKHKRDDVVIVTETHIRVFGDAPKFKEKFALPGSELVGVMISTLSDGCIVISTPGGKGPDRIKGDKGDFIFDTPHVMEFAAMIMVQFFAKEGPHTPMGECSHGVSEAICDRLTLADQLRPTLKGGKPGLIVFRTGPEEYAIEKVDGEKALVIIAPEVKTTAAFGGRVRASLRMRAR